MVEIMLVESPAGEPETAVNVTVYGPGALL
jgi:hypothetical protein